MRLRGHDLVLGILGRGRVGCSVEGSPRGSALPKLEAKRFRKRQE